MKNTEEFEFKLPHDLYRQIFGDFINSLRPLDLNINGTKFSVFPRQLETDFTYYGECTSTVSGFVVKKEKSEKEKLLDELSSLKNQISVIESKLSKL